MIEHEASGVHDMSQAYKRLPQHDCWAYSIETSAIQETQGGNRLPRAMFTIVRFYR